MDVSRCRCVRRAAKPLSALADNGQNSAILRNDNQLSGVQKPVSVLFCDADLTEAASAEGPRRPSLLPVMH